MIVNKRRSLFKIFGTNTVSNCHSIRCHYKGIPHSQCKTAKLANKRGHSLTEEEPVLVDDEHVVEPPAVGHLEPAAGGDGLGQHLAHVLRYHADLGLREVCKE